jgi:hypothetical protein
VKNPEPNTAPAATPVAPPAVKKARARARADGAAAPAGRGVPPIVGLQQRAVRGGDCQ